MKNDFRDYAVKHLGMNGLALDQYANITSSYINPTIIEERQLNVAQMDVFSRLMMDRIIFLGTQIDDYTANVIQAQLLYLDSAEPGKDVSIYINSPGGSVYAGLGVYDTMQYIQSNVSTICTGMAASMAAVLMVAGEKGKRFALKHSRIMIHQPLGGVQGQASDIEITAREILKLKNELYTIIANHSGQPIERIEKDSDRDHWMTSVGIAEVGIVVGKDCPADSLPRRDNLHGKFLCRIFGAGKFNLIIFRQLSDTQLDSFRLGVPDKSIISGLEVFVDASRTDKCQFKM